jgi:hypothetical protein
MSAFIVSTNHINAIVRVALSGPVGCPSCKWHTPYLSNPSRSMCIADADGVGQMLLDQNYRSVGARYPAYASDVAPRFRFEATFAAPRLTLAEAVKALHCYNYQACETGDWDSTEAFKFTRSLVDSLSYQIPGYDAAPWSIE